MNFPNSEIPIPNTTTEKKGYYISYNKYDAIIYGSITTAIVPNDTSYFYVLNGDHREELNKLNSYNDCLNYFKKNSDLKNKYSDSL